jgi:putative NADPH-quinone reductase
MNVLVVHAHPCEDSFNAYLLAMVMEGLAGHDLRIIDLYRGDEDSDLSWPQALVWVYPTWWSGPPAILKGWIDRSFPPRRRFTNLIGTAVVTTHGSRRWLNLLEGEAGRQLLLRALPTNFHPRCRRGWIALYDIDHSSPERREAFAAHVKAEVRRIIPPEPSAWKAP